MQGALGRLSFLVHSNSGFSDFGGFLLRTGGESYLGYQLPFHGIYPNVLGNLHGAKLRITHGTEVRHLSTLGEVGLWIHLLL